MLSKSQWFLFRQKEPISSTKIQQSQAFLHADYIHCAPLWSTPTKGVVVEKVLLMTFDNGASISTKSRGLYIYEEGLPMTFVRKNGIFAEQLYINLGRKARLDREQRPAFCLSLQATHIRTHRPKNRNACLAAILRHSFFDLGRRMMASNSPCVMSFMPHVHHMLTSPKAVVNSLP
jgi:hypothetical protein